MKLTAMFLLMACLTASAEGISQITLSKKNAPLQEVFKEIQKQSGYEFFYSYEVVQKAGTVTVTVKDATLQKAIEATLQGKKLSYQIIGKTVVIKEEVADGTGFTPPPPPPPIEVHGRIIDEKGNPVIASVTIKGTNRGTNTDENGYFILKDVAEDATLVIAAVNIETKEIKVGGRTELSNIAIKTKITETETVTVNTGYQKIKPNEATGSVVIVTKEQLDKRVATDIITKLEGIVPGLVFNKDPSPFNGGKNQLRIRGESTIFGYSEPLIVLDNFPYTGSINDINPNDVESITILKDAAAASIWGIRAGNGVIVITTKKGKLNQPLRLELNQNITITGKPDLFYVPRMTPSEYIDLEIYLFGKGKYDQDLIDIAKKVVSPVVEILNNRRLGLISPQDSTNQINELRKGDWRDEYLQNLYRKQISQQYQINLSGGGLKTSYFFSAGYDKNTGESIGNTSNRITLSNGIVFRPLKKLEFETSINYSESNNTIQGLSDVNNIYPYMRLRDDAGNELPVAQFRSVWEDTIVNHGFYDMKYYPLQERWRSEATVKTSTTRLGALLRYNLLSGLSLRGSYQYIKANTASSDYQAKNSWTMRERMNAFAIVSNGIFTGTNYPVGGQLNLGAGDSKTHNGRVSLDFSRTRANHALVAMAGVEVNETITSNTSSLFYGFDKETGRFTDPDLFMSYPILSGVDTIGYGNIGSSGLSYKATTRRTRSLFSNFSYTFMRKYTISGSARFDQANIFGAKANKKGTPLWSLGTKWDISKEKFYKLKIFPDLSLRVTYGYQGNISPNAIASTIIENRGLAQYTGQPYSQINNFPNPELGWEKSGQLNIGLTFSTKNQNLSGNIEYFIKKGKNLIGDAPLDPTTGVLSIKGNFSNMKTTGFDLSLTSQNLKGKINWTTTVNFSCSKENVTRYDLPNSVPLSFLSGYLNINPLVGYPLHSVFSYHWAGLDPTNGSPIIYLGDTLNHTYTSATSSQIKLSDLVYSGRYNPPYSGSIYNELSWKNFTLAANITYKLGHVFRRSSIQYNNLFTNWRDGHADYQLRWQKPGDEKFTNVPSMIYPLPNPLRDAFYAQSDILIEKADHIRLQFVNLSYRFNNQLLQKSKIQELSIFFYANNLGILWRANDKGIDPDYPYLNYPPSRSYSFGIKAAF